MPENLRTSIITLLQSLLGQPGAPKVRIFKLLDMLSPETESNFTWKKFEQVAGYTSRKPPKFKYWDLVFDYCGGLHDPELNQAYVKQIIG